MQTGWAICRTALIESDAKFSDCRRYRYWLIRRWDASKPLIAFIGLNPSTADETKDDPTMRKIRKFATAWGYGGFLMLNLFAYRATKPTDMTKARKHMDIIGRANTLCDLNNYLREFGVGSTVAAWGHYKTDRGESLKGFISNLDCLGVNKDGSPKHPLYLRDDTKLRPFNY
jgi:hypothetical protein